MEWGCPCETGTMVVLYLNKKETGNTSSAGTCHATILEARTAQDY